MRVGFVGLGKLGLPVAVCMSRCDHDVMGHDLDPKRMSHDPQPYREAGPDGSGDFNDALAQSSIRFGTLAEVCDHGEVIFVAVQTPHDPRFEGITPLTTERRDFDYSFLEAALRQIADIGTRAVVAIVSTVLPGTTRRITQGLGLRIVYNPSFIAMGTVMRDYMRPEFILIGSDDDGAAQLVETVHGAAALGAPVEKMAIESAELCKVSYNTFISAKLAFANTMLEMCERVPGADVDEIMSALCSADRRLISTAYLYPGMGDGGGCHPRDNIAMSWLARKCGLGFDLFEAVMQQREAQAAWLARLMVERRELPPPPGGVPYCLPLCIAGYTFKRETNITTGSHALLVASILAESGFPARMWDPHAGGNPPSEASVVLIGMDHEEVIRHTWPAGSIIIDPWRLVEPAGDVTVIRLGEAREGATTTAREAA